MTVTHVAIRVTRTRHRLPLREWVKSCRSGGDDDILLSVHHISCRGGSPRVGQLPFPQQFSASAIEGVEFVVEEGGPDEKESTGSHDRPPVVFEPVFFIPLAASSGYSPKGIFHRYSLC